MTTDMATAGTPGTRRAAARVPALAAALAFALGATALLGWAFRIEGLRGAPGITGVVNPMTAFGLALGAAALICLHRAPPHTRRNDVGLLLAALATAIGVLRLASLLFPFPLEVDLLLFPNALGATSSADWRMGWATATSIAALGGALLLADRRSAAPWALREGLIGVAFGLALEALIRHTYAFGPASVAVDAETMALQSAIAVAAIGLGTLLARTEAGVSRLITGRESGSVLLRRVLPTLAGLVIVLGWMRLNVQRDGSLSPGTSVGLVVLTALLLLGTLLLVHAAAMNRAERSNADAMRKLAASEDRFRQLFEAAPVGILIADSRGRCRYANSRWQSISGLTPDQAAGHGWMKAIHPDDRRLIGELWRHASASGTEFSSEVRVRRADGEERIVIARAITMLDADGNPAGYANTSEDITEWKRVQQQLADARSNELAMKDQLLSNVSHELRSPLTAIYEFTALLRDGLAGPVNEQQLEFLATVLRNTEQLRELIDDLLEVSRARSGKLRVTVAPFDLTALVGDVVEGLRPRAAKRGLTLTLEGPEAMPITLGDERRMRQVIANLLDNAFKFTPEGGAIRVRLWADEVGRTTGVSIADSGPGIAAEERERIFEYLYQANSGTEASRKGLGIGLYVCRELMTLQKGRIWVETVPAPGTTFSIALPEFSVAALLAPVVEKPGSPESLEAALVRVRLRGSSGRPLTSADAEALGAAQDLLERCSQPDRDVLLPNLGHSALGEYWLFARADERGARVLAERIQKLLGGSKVLNECQLTADVSVQPLEPPALRADAGPDQLARAWAVQILARLEGHAEAEASAIREAA